MAASALSAPTRLGLATLAGAVAIGLAADALLRVGPWGINFSFFVVAMILVLLVLRRWQRAPSRTTVLWAAIPAIVFAGAYAWRDSPVLQNLNMAAAALALALLALYSGGGSLLTAKLGELAMALCVHFFELYIGPLPVMFGVRWGEVRALRLGRLWSVLRGLAIAIPIVLLFGKLLSSADAVFDAFAREVFRIELADVSVQLIVILLTAYFASAWLHRAIGRQGWTPRLGGGGGGPLGKTELILALGGLNALFVIFVVIQARYFFGGADVIAITPNLTYAEYARRGFFELVWVSGLALPVLLLMDALHKPDRDEDVLFRLLAATTTVLLFVVMLSAVQRMRLYVDEFGLTELRLYPTVFMAWLALVFVWFAATVLRGRGRRFAFGAVMAGFATLAALNALNPDAFIARVNLDRPSAARSLDLAYLFSLSGDAVPILIEALPTLPAHEAPAAQILSHWTPPERPDWRTYNSGRNGAWEAVNRNRDRLLEMAPPIWRQQAEGSRR